MNLVVDVGNTFIKAGIFNGKELIHSYHHLKEEDLDRIIAERTPRYVIISSVRGDNTGLKSKVMSAERCIEMNPQVKLPLKNLYKTPQTLGMDRIAGAAGAMDIFPGSDRLVIDAGTCITYDFIDRTDAYQGGSISPGIEMRFKALNTYTQKLPLVNRAESAHLIGGNTEESILSGVLNGIRAEAEGIIGRYRKDFPELKVILCGGDTGFFESKIKEPIFAVPDLVLMGLNSILLYNVAED